MPELKATDPIGDPEPIAPGEHAWERVATGVAIATDGFLVCAFLVAPTRVQGATRSARLRWEGRQKQIQDAMECQQQAQPGNPTPTAGPPTVPIQ